MNEVSTQDQLQHSAILINSIKHDETKVAKLRWDRQAVEKKKSTVPRISMGCFQTIRKHSICNNSEGYRQFADAHRTQNRLD